MPPLGIPRILGVSISDLPGQMPGQVSEMETLVRLDANGDGLLLLSELQKGFVRKSSAGAVARLFLAQPKNDQSDWLAALDGAAVGKLLAVLPPEKFHDFLTQEISRWPDTSQGLIEAMSFADPKDPLGRRLRHSFKTFQPPQQVRLLLATESRWHQLFLSSLCTDSTDMRDLAFLMIRLPHVDANGQFGAMLFSQLGEKCSEQLIAYMDLNMYFANGNRVYRDYLVNAQHLAQRIHRSGMATAYIPSPGVATATMKKMQLAPATIAREMQDAVRIATRGTRQNPGCALTYFISQGRHHGTVIPGTTAPALPPPPSAVAAEIAVLQDQLKSSLTPKAVHAQLGELYYKSGNYWAAVDAFDKALAGLSADESDPQYIGRAQYFLAKTLQRLPKDRHPEEGLEGEMFLAAALWWDIRLELDDLLAASGETSPKYFDRHPDEREMFQEALCYMARQESEASIFSNLIAQHLTTNCPRSR